MEREQGLHQPETGWFYPTDELDASTVIEVSTRGTLRSDFWLMWLAEKLIIRSYHLLDYD